MKALTTVCFTLLTLAIGAQVTITNTTFPKVGDTLRYAFIDNIPATLSMGNVGGPQTWDFSALNMGQKNNQIFISPSAGKDAAAFPDATLLLQSDQQELYLKSSATKIEALGFAGANPFFNAPLLVKYTKKPVFRAAPLTFISTSNSSAEFRIDISTSIIPDTLLANLPIKPDSIRILFANSDKGLLDGFGTLKMQGKTFSVLREKVESISETKLFIKLFGLWIDPLPLLGGNIPGGFGGFLGQDTTYTYNFYTDSKKEVLLAAQYTTGNEATSLQIADLGGIISSSDDVNTTLTADIIPNPASDFCRFQVSQLRDGLYLMTIHSMQGVPVSAGMVQVTNGGVTDIDLRQIPAGQYVITLIDKANSQAISERLTIARK
jgi:hypothetical protein